MAPTQTHIHPDSVIKYETKFSQAALQSQSLTTMGFCHHTIWMNVQQLGLNGTKRYGKVLRDNLNQSSTKPICRLARRGFIKPISGLMYKESRDFGKVFLKTLPVLPLLLPSTPRERLTLLLSVVYTLKHQRKSLYEFWG